jgi:hypothetical protein
MIENDEYFSRSVKVPKEVEEGKQELEYSFRSGRGAVFRQRINLTVNNRPPEIELSLNRSVLKGDPIKVKTNISDDRNVENVSLKFDGDSYSLENGEASIETTQLYTGDYSLEVRAVDSDGAYSKETANIEIYTEDAENSSTENKSSSEKTSQPVNKTNTSEQEQDNSEESESTDSIEEEDDNYKGFNELVLEPVNGFIGEYTGKLMEMFS